MKHFNMDKFSREKHVLLIELVKQYPEIYDTQDVNYKVRSQKKCWEEIAKKVGFSVTDCKRKWKNTRDQYTRKAKESKTGYNNAALTNWEFTPMMAFLADHIKFKTNDSDDVSPINCESDSEDWSIGDDSTECHQPKKKKSENETLLEIFNKIETERALLLGELIENTRERTPTKMFFDSMAAIVEGFPKHMQADVRQKVCNLITDMQIKIENELDG